MAIALWPPYRPGHAGQFAPPASYFPPQHMPYASMLNLLDISTVVVNNYVSRAVVSAARRGDAWPNGEPSCLA